MEGFKQLSRTRRSWGRSRPVSVGVSELRLGSSAAGQQKALFFFPPSSFFFSFFFLSRKSQMTAKHRESILRMVTAVKKAGAANADHIFCFIVPIKEGFGCSVVTAGKHRFF